ncbi:hypothetical protein IMZ48_19325 [Candidatus Bathyarchaeota archaeon]|nr:hypothetical protein [Candidatus Bathyarchaeota archaeon]
MRGKFGDNGGEGGLREGWKLVIKPEAENNKRKDHGNFSAGTYWCFPGRS